jgi:hypothetical protein
VKVVNEKIKNESERLEKLNIKIRFQLSGVPPLFLRLSKDGVRVNEGDLENADVTVISDSSTFSILKEKKNRKRNLIKALFTRKLKIKASPSNLFRFYRSFWLIEEVFSGKIS